MLVSSSDGNLVGGTRTPSWLRSLAIGLVVAVQLHCSSPGQAPGVTEPELEVPAGLIVDAVTHDLGRFHREDDRRHPASGASALALPVGQLLDGTAIIEQYPLRFTVFFRTFDQLGEALHTLTEERKLPLSLLYVHAHGRPGALWIPRDEPTSSQPECAAWRSNETLEDAALYDDYYRLPDPSSIPRLGGSLEPVGCTVGATDWRPLLTSLGSKVRIAPRAVVVFVACSVGFGEPGLALLETVAEGLAARPGLAVASPMYVAADNSLRGMGFWDFSDEASYRAEEVRYRQEKRDAAIVLPGALRIVEAGGESRPREYLLEDLEVVPLDLELEDWFSLLHDWLFPLPVTLQ